MEDVKQETYEHTQQTEPGEQSRQHQEEQQKEYSHDYENWMSQLRKISLAATGACIMLKEETVNCYNKLVDKGLSAKEESKKWVKEKLEKGYKQTQNTMQSAVDMSFENIEKVLNKMNIPKKSDVDELSKRLDALAEKIEALKQAQGQ
jgi:poly(hydroxyalkanoate) granule-associated protein